MKFKSPLFIAIGILITTFLFSVYTVPAQMSGFPLKCKLIGNEKLSPFVAEWGYSKKQLRLWITNTTKDTVTAILQTSVLLGEELCIRTNSKGVKRIKIAPGEQEIDFKDFCVLDSLRYYNSTKQKSRQGFVPEGNGMVCVQVLDTNATTFLAESSCIQRSTIEYKPAEIVYPGEFKTVLLENDSSLTLTWHPVTPTPLDTAIYQIQVFELGPDQVPAQVIRTSTPIFSVKVKNDSSCILPLPSFTGVKYYVWQIKSTNNKGWIYGANEGFSKETPFRVAKNKAVLQEHERALNIAPPSTPAPKKKNSKAKKR